jgi:hypothetical protein
MHYTSKKLRAIFTLFILSISFVLTKEIPPRTVKTVGSNMR